MREAFFILLVIGVILALTAFRYRSQVGAVYRFWKVLPLGKNSAEQRDRRTCRAVKGPLVNCAKCGTWVPESKAIKLGTRVFYCSAACVEKSASAGMTYGTNVRMYHAIICSPKRKGYN
jgi:hypothetical protein